MTITITYDEAKKILGEIAAESPGRVFSSGEEICRYFDPITKECECIIGHFLHRKGVTYDDLGEDLNGEAYSALDRERIISADPKTHVLLATAQHQSDAGSTAITAVTNALKEAEEYEREPYIWDE